MAAGMSTSTAEQNISSWAQDLRRKNPLDHLGRSASRLAAMAADGTDAGESLCTQCGGQLHVCDGDSVPAYLAHSCTFSESRCPGSFETLWHLMAKRSAARIAGWSSEVAYEACGGRYRADAMHLDSGRVFEAVHSLSRDYAEKHLNTMRSGRSVTWLFDSSAAFARPMLEGVLGGYPRWVLKFDADYASRGQLVAAGILRKRARMLVQEIGVGSCFLYFCGHCFHCINCDENGDLWELADDSCVASRVIYGHGGINFQIVHARAAGESVEATGDLDTSDYGPRAETILKRVVECAQLRSLRTIQSDFGRCVSRDQALSVGLDLPPDEWPGVLVNLPARCLCGSLYGVDVPIHGGESTRRDCAQCMKFLGFPRWYSTDTEATDGTHT
ncbi:MAG: hypothetical protein EBR82_50745 [Caulobacteraceae bacterium]|nr:hypothetical protein [Caulobacteraceae bacterium]